MFTNFMSGRKHGNYIYVTKMGRAQLLFQIYVIGCYLAISNGQVLYGYEDESKNLVNNWDFEDDFNPDNSDWYVSHSDYDFNEDAFTGNRSVRIYNRQDKRLSGVFQKFKNLKAGTPYYLSTYFKVTQNPSIKSEMFYPIKLYVSYQNTADKTKRIGIGRLPFVRQSGLWRQLGGDFIMPANVSSLKFEVEVTDRGVEYLLDTVSLIELSEDPNWKATASAEIEKHRKTVVNIIMKIPERLPYCRMIMKIHQEKSHFGFGETLRAEQFNEQTAFGTKYRAHVTDQFEWSGFMNAMKWKPMERFEGYPRYEKLDTAMNYLEAHNMSIRGHSQLWSTKDNNPTWVQDLTGPDLLGKINNRIDNVTSHFKGRLVQWDVVNENLHNKFYSESVGNPYLVDDIHNRIHSIDPDVALYLNDYQALRSGDFTSALADQARDMLSRGVHVNGIGMQSHLRETPINPAIMKKRLQIATSTPLPVTLTELSIHNKNVTKRAEQLEIIAMLTFSNPKVDGIVFWGPSDIPSIAFEPEETALFEGEDFLPNEAGQTLLSLMAGWRSPDTYTKSTQRAMKSTHTLFQGAYTASLYYKDIFVKNESFYVHPGSSMNYRVPGWRRLAKALPIADGDWDCMPQ